MDNLTVKLTIHGLTKDQADSIYRDAVDICHRDLEATMHIEIKRRETPQDG